MKDRICSCETVVLSSQYTHHHPRMERPAKRQRAEEAQALEQLRDIEVLPQLFSSRYRDIVGLLLMYLPSPSIESVCLVSRAVRKLCDNAIWIAVRMADFMLDASPDDNRLPGPETRGAYIAELKRVSSIGSMTEEERLKSIIWQKKEYGKQIVASRFNVRHGPPVRLYVAWMTASDGEFNLDWWEKAETVDVSVKAANVMPVKPVESFNQEHTDLARRYGAESAWLFEMDERFEGTHFGTHANKKETYRMVIFGTRSTERQKALNKREIYKLLEIPATEWDILQEFWSDTGKIPNEKETYSTQKNYRDYSVEFDVRTASSVDVEPVNPQGDIWSLSPVRIYWFNVEALQADAFRMFTNTPGRLALRFQSGQFTPTSTPTPTPTPTLAVAPMTMETGLDTGPDIEVLEQKLCWHTLNAELLGPTINPQGQVHVINVESTIAGGDDDNLVFLFDSAQNQRYCKHSFCRETLLRWLQYEKSPEQTRLCPHCYE